jgi:hypothetical protein
MLDYIYALCNGGEWEDMIIIIDKTEAINISIKYPQKKVEIFMKRIDKVGYIPTYNYYENGIYIEAQ